MSKSLRNCLLLLGLFLFVDSALALAVEQKLSKSWPLNHFMSENKPLMLKSVDGSYNLSFPVSERVKPLSAELNLVITNSNLLHQNRSQLVVYINNYIVGQIKLDPVNKETQAKFVIDKEYLIPGYNQISLKVAQHYTETQCEDWSSPELWTNINTEKSTLALNYEELPVNAKLSALNSLINNRLDNYSLSILRANETISDDFLYWGAMVAQSVKLRLKHVPMKLDEQLVKPYYTADDPGKSSGRFNLNPEQLKHDAVLLGTKEQLGQLIPAEINKAITGAYLGIFQQDQDKNHFILVISGNTNAEVKKAVQSFALFTAIFPDTQQTIVDQILFPDNAEIYSHQSILPDHTYHFAQLGFDNKSLNAVNSETRLDIRIPADLYGTEDQLVKIHLDLAYGAGMRKDSVINISLNGLFNHAIQLKEEGGAHYRNYQITIPLRSFKAGLNTLSFSSVLTPSESGECIYVQRDNLLVSIYEDSTISFPDVGRGAVLPDLQLLERTSFPLIKNGSAGETVFRVLDNSSDSITAAWYLIAKLAAYFETPAFDLNITQGKYSDDKNVVLIGKLSPDNQSVLEGSPVKLGALSKFPYQFKEQQQQPEETFWEWLDRVVSDQNASPLPTAITPENVPIVQTAGLGDEFLMMSYPSPGKQGYVTLALLSEKDNSLSSGVNTLFSPQLWSQLKGNIFLWDNQKKFYSQQEGDTFLTGHGNTRLTMIMYFSKHPWHWLALILPLLLLIAWLIHKSLTKYKKQTHPRVDE
ncbi:MAG: cellulose biosynthesis cyclic di-GMP-binding regulatory protein BcsB [Methylococcales bacterium]|nr:cellulose biosynthesis cyclic di-GMP-binding regulatory protein BcsB [Methylococcales bacterium]